MLAQTLKEIHEQANQFPTPPPASMEDTEGFLKTYNERLAQKLSEKVAEYDRRDGCRRRSTSGCIRCSSASTWKPR